MVSEARAPNYELAELDYISGMKYKDIALKYNVTLNTVKSWKTRYAWSKKGVHTKLEKVCTQKKNANPIADEVKQVMDNPELTDKQRLFCLYYSKNFNAPQSYAKAYGCTIESAAVNAYRLMANDRIKEELQALREIKLQQLSAGEADLVDIHMRIAFADIGEYVNIKMNMLYINNFDRVDTQLIKEVKETKEGISIKLIDRCKSFDWLDRYFLMNPLDKHRIEYDKRKLELDILKLDYEAKKNEPTSTATAGSDNFLEVLNAKAEEAWNDDE